MNKKAFCCWSGGKESCLSYYEVTRFLSEAKGSYYKADAEITCLLSMISEDEVHSRTHGISLELLRLQAKAIGVLILQRSATWETYEDEFKKAVLGLKKDGISIGVFGDIDLQGHRDWVERVCQETGIQPILPLWQEDREKLLNQFISVGFKAIVCTTKADLLGEEWLGHKIDETFIKEIKELGNIDPVRNKSPKETAFDRKCQRISNGVDLCGENGEYHTFVYDGPIFKEQINLTVGKKVLRNDHWLLEGLCKKQ